MESPSLESRAQTAGQMPENPKLRWLVRIADSRWLWAFPIAALVGVGVQSYLIIPKIVAKNHAHDTFRAKYGDVGGGPVDVNKDGQYEYGISLKNSKGELEQWVYDTNNGQPVLRRVAEVKDRNIIYDRTIPLE